jgi:hypothetical protein
VWPARFGTATKQSAASAELSARAEGPEGKLLASVAGADPIGVVEGDAPKALFSSPEALSFSFSFCTVRKAGVVIELEVPPAPRLGEWWW